MRSRVLLSSAGRALVRAAAVAGIGASSLSGCLTNPKPKGHPADVIAVAVSDSVAGGQTLGLRVHWAGETCCEALLDWEIRALDDTTFQLTMEVGGGDECACAPTELEHLFSLNAVPARRFHLRIVSPNDTLDIPVEGGTGPGPLKRYRVELVDYATQAPVAGVGVRIIRFTPTQASVYDTLSPPPTDATGATEIGVECPSAYLPYQIELDKAGTSLDRRIFEGYPGGCSIPERVVIRVQ